MDGMLNELDDVEGRSRSTGSTAPLLPVCLPGDGAVGGRCPIAIKLFMYVSLVEPGLRGLIVMCKRDEATSNGARGDGRIRHCCAVKVPCAVRS